MIVLLVQIVVYGLAKWMSDDLRKEILHASSSGKKFLCFANTEPDCGSDAAAIKSEAVRKDDYYVISGEKTSISGGMQADGVFMTAKTDPRAGGRGISLFFVPTNSPGVSRSIFHDMGNTSAGRASIFFDQVRVPIAYRIGNEGEGFTKILRTFDVSRVLVALSALALAETSLAEAIEYVKTRKAFNNPLSSFQGISYKLAEHATMLEAARMLCYKALKLRDEGLDHAKESAMVKWFAPKCAVDATHDIILLLGYRGYSDESAIQQRWRDVISCFLGDGTAEIMKIIIGRELIGTRYVSSI